MPAILAAIYQLGLLLLMFISGSQMRGIVDRRSARSVGLVTSIGLVVPFLAGLGLVVALGSSRFEGDAGSRGALVLVFGIGVAVTSIPVISRILHDLGLLRTRFARLVLSVAVLEDVVVYVVLAIAIGMAGSSSSTFGLGHALGIESVAASSSTTRSSRSPSWPAASSARRACHAGYCVTGSSDRPPKPDRLPAPMDVRVALAALLLGIVPIFGAFIAGLSTYGDRHEGARDARAAISSFGFAFLIPIYFAVVGVKLDLLHDFDLPFFLGFLAFACAVKAVSVFAAARLAGETPRIALHLAIAVNARGGPGIVLASVAYDARHHRPLVLRDARDALGRHLAARRLVARARPRRAGHPRRPGGDAAGDGRLRFRGAWVRGRSRSREQTMRVRARAAHDVER